LLIGASAGHFDTIGGTLGCFVTMMNDGDHSPRILSNNHVLANENRGKSGDDIVQRRTAGLAHPAFASRGAPRWAPGRVGPA